MLSKISTINKLPLYRDAFNNQEFLISFTKNMSFRVQIDH